MTAEGKTAARDEEERGQEKQGCLGAGTASLFHVLTLPSGVLVLAPCLDPSGATAGVTLEGGSSAAPSVPQAAVVKNWANQRR